VPPVSQEFHKVHLRHPPRCRTKEQG
jgi:hypothetical protein